jgi:hypothetical protein
MSAKDDAAALRRQADQLEVVGELEERLVTAKDGDDPDELKDAKRALREARAEYRENRVSVMRPGDTAVQVDVVRGGRAS